MQIYQERWVFEQSVRAKFLTDKQVSTILGVSVKTVQRWRLENALPEAYEKLLSAVALGHILPRRWVDQGFYFEDDILVARGRFYDTKKLLCVDEALWLIQQNAKISKEKAQQLRFRLENPNAIR